MKELQSLLTDFNAQLSQTIEQTWAAPTRLEYLESLASGSKILAKSIIQVGDFCTEKISSETENLFPHYLVLFSWTGKAKSFLILWRDVLFQAQKSYILNLEKKVSLDDLTKLQTQSKATVLQAAKELEAYFEEESQRILRLRNGQDKHLYQWGLQQSPYPVLREQIELLSEQCMNLIELHQEVYGISENLIQIKKLVQKNFDDSKQEIDSSKESAQSTKEYISQHKKEKISKIPTWVEDVENNMASIDHLDILTTSLNEILEKLPKKVQIPVNTDGGLIQFKEINIQKSVRLWLESEVFPVLYESREIVTSSTKEFKITLLNIRNRTVLLSNEWKENESLNFENENLERPLSVFLENANNHTSNLTELEIQINERLVDVFGVFSVYHLHQTFLPLPLQSTINQFTSGRNKILEGLLRWWKKQRAAFQRFTTSIKIEESLSLSEKVVRFVQSRETDLNNQHYSSIFLTKGYIGESFLVGRKNELAHIDTLVSQWQQGFRGAVILSGQRLSGKSLFGDLVALRYFSKNTIRLAPNSSIKIEGRQFKCKCDLGEAMDFIKKYTVQKSALIWIDDLELWDNAESSLNQNVRQLCRNIDSHSKQLFFLVSMSNWAKRHLNKIHDLDKKFQAEINLDQMSASEVQEAILIRHGATHKMMVGSDGDEIRSSVFQKIISRIYKTAGGNIGEALNLWAQSTYKYSDETVSFKPLPSYLFPDFENPDTGIVLATLMMEKRTNEYRLRKLFGPAFKEKYLGIVQRLISLGILTRHHGGELEVNEAIANEVGRLLDQKQFLRFQYKK